MKITTHRYTGKDVPNHIERVERDLPENRIVWVSNNGGRSWERVSVADVCFIDAAIGQQQQIVLAPEGPEYL